MTPLSERLVGPAPDLDWLTHAAAEAYAAAAMGNAPMRELVNLIEPLRETAAAVVLSGRLLVHPGLGGRQRHARSFLHQLPQLLHLAVRDHLDKSLPMRNLETPRPRRNREF